MKATQLCLAATVAAGSLCLAACGDDSNPPLPNSTSGTVVTPVDKSPATSSKIVDVTVKPDGAIAAPVSVGTDLHSGGSHSRASVAEGTKVFDTQGNAITSGQLEIALTTYNSNDNEGLKAFADSRPKGREGGVFPRGVSFGQISNPSGAMDFRAAVKDGVTSKPVNALQGAGGGSGVRGDYCSPRLSAYKTATVYMGTNSFSVMIATINVSRTGGNGCVAFAIPSKWPGNMISFVFSGRDLAPVTGLVN